MNNRKSLKRSIGRAIAWTLTAAMIAGNAPAGMHAEAAAAVKAVKVTNVKSKTLKLTTGKKFTLKVKVKKSGKASSKVTFKSSKPKIASVSKKGVITAKKKGKCFVTVASVCNKKKKATIKVIVSAKAADQATGTPAVSQAASTPAVSVNPAGNTPAAGSNQSAAPVNTAQTNASAEPTKEAPTDASAEPTKEAPATEPTKEVPTKVPVTEPTKEAPTKAPVTEPTKEAPIEAPTETPTEAPTETPSEPVVTPLAEVADVAEAYTAKLAGDYEQVWKEDFDGDSLNTDDWNVEVHEPGWVNAELQEYTPEGNYTVSDGKLTIQPRKTDGEDGKATYTSARINTQNKHDFTYGLFEVVAKVPEGKGFLPAFWMMPTDENLYGQWPKCGEIDIMEVMGHETDKLYGTIHYGEPHGQKQGTYKTEGADFANQFHTFACDWEPGKITWYVDGVKFYETSDWFSAKPGQGTVTYPAPFDQPFYMILNLAVGGSWVGYPDADQDINSQSFQIESVKAYQRTAGYDDSNVTAPTKAPVELRNPMVHNGDFGTEEALDDDVDWKFMAQNDGVGSAEITDGRIVISTEEVGTQDYSIQLVQPDIPAKQGDIYTLTFDAYADEARTMKVDVSAPERSYMRYLPDTVVDLGTEAKTYTFEYEMTEEDDAQARLEFNLGNTSSKAKVYITNVKLEKTDSFEISDAKTVLADGNYVYNGAFQEGEGRLGYWEIGEGLTATVTGIDDGRSLKAEAAAGSSISQKELALTAGEYMLKLDAKGAEGKKLKVTVAGVEAEFTLTGEKETLKKVITLPDDMSNKDFAISFEDEGTYYVDNVSLVENALIKNGSFNGGLSGFDVYVDGSAAASYVVDSQTEKNALDLSITNTSDAEWKIQVKQSDVVMEKDQWYRLSFDIRSSIDRSIQYAIQRNGAVHKTEAGGEDWTPYVQSTEGLKASNQDYTTVTKEFKMKEATDEGSIFNIALGGGDNTTKHRVCIDNIKLEKIEEPEIQGVPSGTDILKNGSFAEGNTNWSINTSGDKAACDMNKEAGSITFDITDVGEHDYDIQLKQSGLALDKDSTYTVSFDVTSSEARTIKSGCMSTSYAWYGGTNVALEKDQSKKVSFTVTAPEGGDDAADFFVSMGQIKGVETPASTITISNLKFVKD